MTSTAMSVALLSNRQRSSIESGSEMPCLVQTEQNDTSVLLIDSKDRIQGNASSFYIDLGYQLSKGRYMTLKRVIVPKIPNITPNNNQIQLRSGATSTAVLTIPVGLYNTTTLANTLTSVINTGFLAAGIIDTVTVNFDSVSRTFSLTSVNGIPLAISSTCSFIRYGLSLCPFESQDLTVAPTKTTLRSTLAGMLYSRYLTVSSDTLTQYSLGDSILSSATQPPSIMGVVDLIDLYNSDDFDITSVYTGVYRAIDINTGVRMRIMNGSRSIPNQIDIDLKDMYGFGLESSIQLGSPWPVDTSTSITLIFEVAY